MPEPNPSFVARIFIALVAFFRIVFNGDFAAGVVRLTEGAAPEPEPPPAPPPEPKLREANTDAALQILGLLQREGRLIDFLNEDISSYSDADVGAAARVVHERCKKALETHVTLSRVRGEPEGSQIAVQAGFSSEELRLVGNVVGQPPFHGTLVHAGWRVAHIELPRLSEGRDVHVVAPAEVEL